MASEFASEDISAELTRFNNEVIRIVLVGKTGAGKSAAGNTILGKTKFKSKLSPKSLTLTCAKSYSEVDGQKIAVIDTPGLFDTRSENLKDIVQCISYASPGPHIFLIVIKLGRYTDEEKKTVQKIQETFGEEADKHSMVLFTHGDLLQETSIEEFLGESEELQELVAKCNGWYHIFSNDMTDRSQVSELLKKIKTITEKNGGGHYTTEMFQVAERAIEEEKQRILKEKEEEMLREMENMRKKIEKKFEQQMRAKEADMKKNNEFIAAREREIEEKMAEMKTHQEMQARQEAERSESLLTKIGEFLGKVLEKVVVRMAERMMRPSCM